jgi:16S rRNA (cytidine1402-2'-O)-methyltransferase
MKSHIYLIPCTIADDALHSLSPSILEAVKKCEVFFVEEERTARRFLKKIWRDMVIDNYEWVVLNKDNNPSAIKKYINLGKTIGIISEAGCPGVADPGQDVIRVAQEMECIVHPLVGPNAILLALMASGMNGQHFQFVGYLPIDIGKRIAAIKALEIESIQKKSTQIFIETPYRNNQMFQSLLGHLKSTTLLCVAAEITSPNEFIKTMSVAAWKNNIPELHKKPVIFLVLGV